LPPTDRVQLATAESTMQKTFNLQHVCSPFWRAAVVMAIAIAVMAHCLRSDCASNADPPPTAPTGKTAADGNAGPARRARIVGSVMVEGTDEPVSGAIVQVMIGVSRPRSFRNICLYASTDASGRYEINVPVGYVHVGIKWVDGLPPGYWRQGHDESVITTPSAPHLRRDFKLRRGPVWRLRAFEPSTGKPVASVRCWAQLKTNGKVSKGGPIIDTDADGAARITLPAFDGEFSISANDIKSHGKWQVTPAHLTVERGFQVDRVREINPEAGGKAFRFRLKDEQGKTATVSDARVSLVDGKVVIDLQAKLTAAPMCDIRGIIVDQKGRPVAEAWVTAVCACNGGSSSTASGATTDNEGRFSLQQVLLTCSQGEPARGVYLVVRKDGFGAIDSDSRPIPNAPRTPIDFGRVSLSPGASLRLRIVDRQGQPVAGAWIWPGRGMVGTTQMVMSDEHGECIIYDLRVGLTTIFANYGDWYGEVEAHAGNARSPIVLQLKKGL
jgi:hypothetical protein